MSRINFSYQDYLKGINVKEPIVIKTNATKKKGSKTLTRGDTRAKMSKVSGPVGTAFPSVNTNLAYRKYGIRELEETARIPPVARSIMQLKLTCFKYFTFIIVPPYGEDDVPDDVREKLEPKMEKLNRSIDTTNLCKIAIQELLTYGNAIFEIVWGKDDDGWVVPKGVQWLPASSFAMAPPQVSGNTTRYVTGQLLRGIVLDREDNSYHYYQTQDAYSAAPVEIPNENVIHIRDWNSPYVDGEPYLAGIVHTVSQLEFVRKRMMQAVSRCGTPTMKVQVGVPPEYLQADLDAGGSGITSAVPGEASASLSDAMFTQLWDIARVVGESQSSDIAVVVPKGVDVDWQRPAVPINITEYDQYLIREAVNHIFPRDTLEVFTSSITTTTTPLLELLKILVEGWQQVCAIEFEDELWTKFAVVNGFENYRIELEWAPPIPEDKAQTDREWLEKFNNHVITLDEYREAVGLPPLNDDESRTTIYDRKTIYEELLKFRAPQVIQQEMQQQQGMGGGMPGMEGGMGGGMPGMEGGEAGGMGGGGAGTEGETEGEAPPEEFPEEFPTEFEGEVEEAPPEEFPTEFEGEVEEEGESEEEPEEEEEPLTWEPESEEWEPDMTETSEEEPEPEPEEEEESEEDVLAEAEKLLAELEAEWNLGEEEEEEEEDEEEE